MPIDLVMVIAITAISTMVITFLMFQLIFRRIGRVEERIFQYKTTAELSDEVLNLLEGIASKSSNSLSEIILKGIYLIKIAVDNKEKGYKLAIVDNNKNFVDEITGI